MSRPHLRFQLSLENTHTHTHIQPPTPAQVDNTTALGFVTKKTTAKTDKIILHATLMAVGQRCPKTFQMLFGPVKSNKSDCFTIHFCSTHHSQIRPEQLSRHSVLDAQRTSFWPKKNLIKFNPLFTYSKIGQGDIGLLQGVHISHLHLGRQTTQDSRLQGLYIAVYPSFKSIKTTLL